MGFIQYVPQKLFLVIIFSLLSRSSGELEILKHDSLIKALVGEETTVPCYFSGYKASHLTTSKVAVRWNIGTVKEPVLLFDGGHYTQNRPGLYISESELVRGDASLHIPNLQFSDEGEYTCTIFVTPDKAVSKVTVQVSAIPSCRLSDSALVMNPDTERSVTCYVNGFYPESVEIQWLKYSKASSHQSKLNSQICTSATVQNHDGTYNVTSVLSVRPMSTDEDGDVYSCVISHRSLTDDLTSNVTLSVKSIEDHYIPAWIVAVTVVLMVIIHILVGVTLYHHIKDHYIPAWIVWVIAAVIVIIPILIGVIIFLDIKDHYIEAWSLHVTVVMVIILLLEVVIISLCIKVKPNVMEIYTTELIHMEKSELTCFISRFRPNNLTIKLYFQKHGGNKIEVDSWSSIKPRTSSPGKDTEQGTPLQTTEESTGLSLAPRTKPCGLLFFNCDSFINITPMYHIHNGALLTLEVHHAALTSPIYKELRLKVEYRTRMDQIEANQQLYKAGDLLQLKCKIHSYLYDIKVIWYKDNEQLASQVTEPEKDDKGLFSVTSSVQYNVTEEDFEKLFSCYAIAKKTSKSVEWKLEKGGN